MSRSGGASRTHSAIELSDSTSMRSVLMPTCCDANEAIFDGSRAVAYTSSPAEWNAIASAAPRLPSEQPVMRTFGGGD